MNNNIKANHNLSQMVIPEMIERKDGSIISKTARIKDKRIQILTVDLTNKKCRIVPKRSAEWS